MSLGKSARALAMGALALSSVAVAAADGTDGEDASIAIPAPPPGKGQIVFFRPGGMGFAMGCSVNENGQKVSSLGAGKYFVMVADPGKHEFSVKSEAKDALTLLVEPDETQFAKCKIKMGIMVGRPDIQPSSEQEFREQKKLKLVDADDMGPGPGALRPDEIERALKGGDAPAEPDAASAGETGEATGD